jgi:hypothetical protein
MRSLLPGTRCVAHQVDHEVSPSAVVAPIESRGSGQVLHTGRLTWTPWEHEDSSVAADKVQAAVGRVG